MRATLTHDSPTLQFAVGNGIASMTRFSAAPRNIDRQRTGRTAVVLTAVNFDDGRQLLPSGQAFEALNRARFRDLDNVSDRVLQGVPPPTVRQA
jgi:hypothetical protein